MRFILPWLFALTLQANAYEWAPGTAETPLEIKEDGEHIFIRFDRDFTAVYSKNLCSLYQAWRPAPAAAWDRLPASPYYHQRVKPVWDVRRERFSVIRGAVFSSYVREPNAITLRYTLRLGNGREISVLETPKYDAHYGAPRLMRNMTITGLSAGEQVRLTLSDGLAPVFWRLSGGGELEQGQGISTLVVRRDGFSQPLVLWEG